ncbi:MAG: DUF3369 domain-containing protein [Hahellaceae bacterium]|nr:DUF3369 domain-containing protein [Hahellaceae bacterium]MCP5212119.1 DUF3369 domain-containing protein [Hahellaceae bacterium]
MFKKSSKSKDAKEREALESWKVLVVDDEPEVHSITKVALSEFIYDNRELTLLSAYSGQEAKAILEKEPNIALIYLDVVMETDDAGLKLVKYIREELRNTFVRIILRTGQPGQAPEREVIVNYDINDYKEKTSLDSGKLFTSTYSALRSYSDIMNIERSRLMLDRYRIGLEEVIVASANLFELRSLKMFANGLLIQLGSLLHIDKDTLFVRCNGWTVVQDGPQLEVLAATGTLQQSVTDIETEQTEVALPEEVVSYLNRARVEKCNILENGKFVGYFPTKSGKVNLLYLDGVDHTDEVDVKLVRIFSTNVTIAFDNLYLDKELYETQGEIIETLGDVVETRSKETANHVKRVAHLSRMIAQLYGLSPADCETLFMASPMHDIGKVAIPDRVLLKPGKLDDEEWVIMKTHAQIGADIFARSTRPVLVAASIVAGQHHEKFDGSGYPNGLAGDNIHIFGRIVALVDVFDALIHRRCYKEPWPIEDVLKLFQEQKGLHFDPKLVDILIENLSLAEEIIAQYPDFDS